MKKILLTGATGFIGSEILKNLSQKYKIFIIIRKKKIEKKLLNKNTKILSYKKFRELNKKLLKLRVDYVIHCATHYVKNHSFEDLEKLNKSNILFGNVILENLKKMKVKKFINFSTVWENYNNEKENFFNLYSVYKKIFGNLIDFYKKRENKTQFYTLMISDTFGEFDKRKKIINTLRNNYKKNKITSIVSRNLFLNLLNVKDITKAVDLILKNKITPDIYVLKNKKEYSILKIIQNFNKKNPKKIKIKWISNKILREKIYNYKHLNGWIPTESKIKDIVDLIKK
tara:strand:+ start:474 stop:1328 length:855 start_codon:yes stop_codon:yes gene_type:complete